MNGIRVERSADDCPSFDISNCKCRCQEFGRQPMRHHERLYRNRWNALKIIERISLWFHRSEHPKGREGTLTNCVSCQIGLQLHQQIVNCQRTISIDFHYLYGAVFFHRLQDVSGLEANGLQCCPNDVTFRCESCQSADNSEGKEDSILKPPFWRLRFQLVTYPLESFLQRGAYRPLKAGTK